MEEQEQDLLLLLKEIFLVGMVSLLLRSRAHPSSTSSPWKMGSQPFLSPRMGNVWVGSCEESPLPVPALLGLCCPKVSVRSPGDIPRGHQELPV